MIDIGRKLVSNQFITSFLVPDSMPEVQRCPKEEWLPSVFKSLNIVALERETKLK